MSSTELEYVPDPAAIDAPESGVQATSGFGSTSVARVAETASTALAAQAQASVQARYIMAMQRPRNLSKARAQLLADCKRPAFAEAAIYRKPVGDGVEGPSIRMAEAAARAMTNVLCEVASIYDDAHKRIVRVSATDLESNVTYPMDVTIAKTIERSKPMPGRRVVDKRKNSRGYDVFVIEATDEEILDKERAVASKAMRTCLLRLIPGDILEEAMEQCYRTRQQELQANLPESRAKMQSAFASVGVTDEQLRAYLGHALSDVTVQELADMRAVFNAIKDRETTWAEVMDARRPASDSTADSSAPLAEKLGAKAAAVGAAGIASVDAKKAPKDPAPH